MSEIQKNEGYVLPELKDLVKDREVAFKVSSFNWLCNQKPPQAWIKKHPMSNHDYIPVDKVEHLLTNLYPGWSVKVIDYKHVLNSIAVHVRLTVTNPVTGVQIEMDGLGAATIQVDKGENASNLSAIKPNAITLALPSAESYALKDAAEKLGQIFGSNLARKDVLVSEPFQKVKDRWGIKTEENGTKE